MKTILNDIGISILSTLVFALVLCGIYPLAVWGGAHLLFPAKADGSLVVDRSGGVRGSALIAQGFASDRYFSPRPSAAGNGYDPTNSGGTNLGPTSAKLANDVRDFVAAYRRANGLQPNEPVPADAVTRSGSGLDPDISIANAFDQASRVAAARHLPVSRIEALIAEHATGRDLGVFGEPRVNVLLLNLALDEVKP